MLRYRYPPGRPGHPAEGWVVFLNATWYELFAITCLAIGSKIPKNKKRGTVLS
jgi:hypothetical protein